MKDANSFVLRQILQDRAGRLAGRAGAVTT